MLATLGQLPAPPGWGYEFKWDSVRVVVYLDGGRIRAASRNDRDVIGGYPELRALLGRFPRRRRVILDGEIVALDPKGRPSFGLLQQRMHVRTPSPALLGRRRVGPVAACGQARPSGALSLPACGPKRSSRTTAR